MNDNLSDKLTAKNRYEKMAEEREPYLTRARKNATYTIPYLFPPLGTTGSSDLPDPHQSIGARGVNNLAGKLLLTFAPPSRPFFRQIPNDKAEAKLKEMDGTDKSFRTELELALSMVEQSMMRELGTLRARGPSYEAIREMLVGGNAALIFDEKGTRHFNLSQYVCRRKYNGDVVEFITEETVDRQELGSEWMKAQLSEEHDPESSMGKDTTEVYTSYKLMPNGSWIYFQEADGIEVPRSRGIIGASRAKNFMVLRWTRIDGEHYGRAYCDDCIGDLRTAEGLSRAITRAAAVGAKIIYIVAPNSTLKPQDLEQADDGEFVVGYRDDVSLLSHDAKAYDLNVARQVLAEVTQRVEYMFLMASAVQRDAERVTAEEFRRMSEELETGLGGPYTVLTEDFQLALAELLLDRVVARDPSMSQLPKNIETTLITGVDALGRNQELQELAASVGLAVQILGPGAVEYFQPTELLKRILAANGTRSDNLLKSDEQLAQERQQAQAQALAEKAAAPVAGAVANGAVNGQAEQ